MYEAEDNIAVGYFLNNDAEGKKIVNLLEWDPLFDHLVIDGIEVLWTTANIDNFYTPSLNTLFDGKDDFVNLPLSVSAGAGDAFLHHEVFAGMKVFEAEIFKLPLDLPNTESCSQRGVNVESFGRDSQLLFLGHVAESLHVVKAIGKLDDHDPIVIGHREEHLSQSFGGAGGFGGLFLARSEILLLLEFQLGHAINKA